jgi:hypothetical protein
MRAGAGDAGRSAETTVGTTAGAGSVVREVMGERLRLGVSESVGEAAPERITVGALIGAII